MNVFLLFCVALAAAKAPNWVNYGSEYTRAAACYGAMYDTATFCEDGGYSCFCDDTSVFGTVLGCMHDGEKPKFGGGIKLFCTLYTEIKITKDFFEASWADYQANATTVEEIADFNYSIPVTVPLKLDPSEVAISRQSYFIFYDNYNNSVYYGSGMVAFWGVVFIVAAISHWGKILLPSLTRKCVGPVSNAWRKYVTLPALIGRRKNQNGSGFILFDYLVPSRMESINIFLFCCVTIFCCSHKIYWKKGDTIYPDKDEGLLRYTADRTGIIATYVTPMIILFAGRNNIFIWLTGINFSSFITYHKWTSRICFILVVIHGACYTKLYLLEGYYTMEMEERFFVFGILATVAGGVMWMTALLWIRRNFYEFFVLSHISMGVLFVAGSWVHVVDMGYAQWYYATTGIWAFDRVTRIVRQLWFGCPKATVTLLANETLRVVVPKPKHWPATAGGYAFINFLKPTCFWQSHPFTFTCIPGDTEQTVVMYLKVKGGITHSLCRKLSQLPGNTQKIRVCLEGPYGDSAPAKNYDNAVFIAGGNGIPGIYSEATDLATRDIKQSLKLYWVVREYKSLLWFYQELQALKNLPKIKTTIYITQPGSLEGLESLCFSNEDTDSEKKKLSENDSIEISQIEKIHQGLSHIEFKEGRPSLDQIVKHEIDEAQSSAAFIACGHPMMCDDLRYVIADNLSYSKKRIEYFEQLQVWS